MKDRFLCGNCRVYKPTPSVSKSPSGKPTCAACDAEIKAALRKTEKARISQGKRNARFYAKGNVLPAAIK